jgi:hypothetical protein
MASRAVLPTADEFFARTCLTAPRRPPWSVVGTVELARLLGVHMQSVYNWRCRGTGPEPEAEPRRHYRRVGPRVLHRIDGVLAWLPGGKADPWHWTGRFLVEVRALLPGHLDDPETVMDWIAISEAERYFPAIRWRWRSIERGIQRLRQDCGVVTQARIIHEVGRREARNGLSSSG